VILKFPDCGTNKGLSYLILSYSNITVLQLQPFEGGHDADVTHGEDEFDAPRFKGSDMKLRGLMHYLWDSPTAKSSVMMDGAGFAIDWYAEQAFTISCICRKFATVITSSTF